MIELKMFILTAYLLFSLTLGFPQSEAPPPKEKPMPYDYNYKVEDANNSLYFGAQEVSNEAGRVEGSYYVLLPNRRLMKVAYYVDGNSGFNPKITFEDNANPFGSGEPK